MRIFYRNKKTARIFRNEAINAETEDRLAYLQLSSKEKWNYPMNLILAIYPSKEAAFKNRIIEGASITILHVLKYSQSEIRRCGKIRCYFIISQETLGKLSKQSSK